MSAGLRLSEPQRLALRAALLEGSAAAEAWAAWLATLDFERDLADPAALAVLPLVYRNLDRAGLLGQAGHSARLTGIYRQAWHHGTLTLDQAPAALHALQQAGVPLVLLHHPAHLAGDHPPPGRPLLSLDVWTRSRALPAAEACLRPLGWQAQALAGATQPFRTAAGAWLRLVTRPLPGPNLPVSEALQMGAVPARLSEVQAPALSAADFVLYACTRAARGEAARALAQLAAAAHTLEEQRPAPAVLAQRARALGVVLAGRRALAVLNREAPTLALRRALAALTAAAPTLRERLREATHAHPALRRLLAGARRRGRTRPAG